VKYAFVENHRRQYGVPALCEALQVSRSGYYAARHRSASDRQKRRVELTARIRTIYAGHYYKGLSSYAVGR